MRFFLILFLLGSTSVIAQKNVSISFDLSPSDTTMEVGVFKFYLSSISLQFEDNSVYIEPNSYHLINKEDSSPQSLTLSNVPDKAISKITFTLGTDSMANVSGAMDGDLDPILGMYWAWNSGYINFKLEGKKGNQAFEFHIGGYNGEQATARTLSYSVSADDTIEIKIDPSKFLNQIDLSSTSSVKIPGNEAVGLTNYYPNMISVE
ncbi:MAG: hypothetical protein HRT57_06100 [Crocinitomicaceae bacterium]|nr:hypothetical protein [Crocinitomicaceae bacterium]